MRLKSRLDRIEARTAPEVITLVRVLCVRAGESVAERASDRRSSHLMKRCMRLSARGNSPLNYVVRVGLGVNFRLG